jgi:hypothetical protein
MKEFHFIECFEIKELLGKKADDVEELLELIEEVPSDSIYYHTHSYFLRHFYLTGPYPNDFANWVAIQVRDRVLGEKLGIVMPTGDKSLEDLRNELIEIIDNYLSTMKITPAVVSGQAFYFMQSRIIEVHTGITVNNLEEFVEVLKIIDASAIYNHVFEARVRDWQGRSDFSIWLDEILHTTELSKKLEMIDCYMYSLEGLRNKLIDLCKQELKK